LQFAENCFWLIYTSYHNTMFFYGVYPMIVKTACNLQVTVDVLWCFFQLKSGRVSK